MSHQNIKKQKTDENWSKREHCPRNSMDSSIKTGDRSLNLSVVLRPDKAFPSFGQPRQIGYFGVDGNRVYTNGKTNLKFLYLPSNRESPNFDLNIGYKDVIRKEFGLNERLDFLLKWIVNHKAVLRDVDFINYRGLLTKVMLTPYERQEDWIICATKFRSIIYICSFNTEREKRRHTEQTERDKLMSSWGYKFEQYLMSDTPGKPPDTQSPVNEREEFDCVVKTHINTHKLMFSAEIDGLDINVEPDYPEQTGRTDKYIELKTSRIIEYDRQQRNFQLYKLKKFWAQSFLIGIPKIYCGFRNDDGIVLSVDLLQTHDLPKIAKGMWSPSGCVNFLDEFLSFLKEMVTEDNPRCVYKFEWKPGSAIIGSKLYNSSEFQILPNWYIESFE